MSKKFDEFTAALEALCRERRVQIAVSGYDSLQIWDLKDGGDPIYANGIQDETVAQGDA